MGLQFVGWGMQVDQVWLHGVIRLALLAALFRGASAAARIRIQYFPFKLVGWLLCGLAAWFATAAGGAWVAAWVALALGATGFMAGQWLPGRYLSPITDVVFVLTLFALSRSPIGLWPAIVVAVAYIALGVISDGIARWLPTWLWAVVAIVPWLLLLVAPWLGNDASLDDTLTRHPWSRDMPFPLRDVFVQWLTTGFWAAAAITPLLLVALWCWQDAPLSGTLNHEAWSRGRALPLHLGVSVPNAGKRVVLKDGAVAWILRPSGKVRGGAVLYHGKNPYGSRQHAAFPLQRALVEQGYVVVSLDHPGYGESPHPPRGAPATAWDPLPADRAAYDYMNAHVPVPLPRIAVGHSMGVKDALRLLDTDANLDFAVLLGGAHNNLSMTTRENYWYERFNVDLKLDRPIPRSKWNEIRARYHDSRRMLKRLSKDHGPILFVNFGVDWPNLVATRNTMWKDIPGEKYRVKLKHSTHYFNSFRAHSLVLTRGLVFADVRTVGRLGQYLRMVRKKAGS